MSYFIDKRRQRVGRFLDRLHLKNKSFTLFSNDCWGAEVYKYFGLPFNTPFIGLMLSAPCYLKLLANPKYYLSQPLCFQEQSFYADIDKLRLDWKHYVPIATIGGDVEIQFLHYHSEEEAREKWARRVERINWDNIFLKFDGSKGWATPTLVQEFDQLPYPKLTLLREPQMEITSAVVVPRYTVDGMQQFERSRPYLDLVGWLNGGSVHPTPAVSLYNKTLFPIIG